LQRAFAASLAIDEASFWLIDVTGHTTLPLWQHFASQVKRFTLFAPSGFDGFVIPTLASGAESELPHGNSGPPIGFKDQIHGCRHRNRTWKTARPWSRCWDRATQYQANMGVYRLILRNSSIHLETADVSAPATRYLQLAKFCLSNPVLRPAKLRRILDAQEFQVLK
jgi:hypothetical protein